MTLRCLHQATDRLEPQTQSTQPKCLKYIQPQGVTVNKFSKPSYVDWEESEAESPALSSLGRMPEDGSPSPQYKSKARLSQLSAPQSIEPAVQ